MPQVCVDASFSLKLVLPEPERPAVLAQWDSWEGNGFDFIAPSLWLYETHSTLRRKAESGVLTEDEAVQAWRILLAHGVETAIPAGLLDRAWMLAAELGLHRTYDMTYLALAELRGCELWTADNRTVNAARGRFEWLHSVDELP